MRRFVLTCAIAFLCTGCGAGITAQDVFGRIPQHAACIMECTACITALHCDSGSQNQPPAAHIACAAACAECASALTGDLAGLVNNTRRTSDTEVESAPLEDVTEVEATEGATCVEHE